MMPRTTERAESCPRTAASGRNFWGRANARWNEDSHTHARSKGVRPRQTVKTQDAHLVETRSYFIWRVREDMRLITRPTVALTPLLVFFLVATALFAFVHPPAMSTPVHAATGPIDAKIQIVW